MTKRDYYEVLGVGKSASADEIKKAYRRLAVRYHPDKQGGDEARFKEINEAYEVLKDPSKRQRYDQFGHAGVGSGGSAGGPFEGFGDFGRQGQNIHFDFGDLGLGDIFSSFFGRDFSSSGGQRREGKPRGRDVAVDIELGFEEAIFGGERTLRLELQSTCQHCRGSGAEPGYELKSCPTCRGSGQQVKVINSMFGAIQQTVVCPTCQGRGRVPEKKCSVCGGKGTKRTQQDIRLKIPPGIDDGATIRLQERGEAPELAGAEGVKGDLYVNVRVKPHKKFTREGDIILSLEHVGMAEAALGCEINVETVDGTVRMKIPPGTQSGTDFKLSGHGVPRLRGSGRGDHIVTIHVDTPTGLNRQQKALLEELRSTR
ncbi:MAG: molecular chaperone DnaJ [Candidatus Chaera renei]|uniref:Chaperone protein DnaJ n=1 Tax=Candidatus Chaera renei TaxID=2506947 RepID=A0A4Q0AHM5_9BACT|nr:MAG: molecular chaperone DnaJ [Candidatus Chaera renei]